jgi:hypothetical protein
MIAGKPSFHGENHIGLLRNIQQKAVRLPPNVKISAEGVKLLRVLLHRNPISRAGFSVFSDASDAFVALGCNGVAGTIVDETTTTSSTTASTLGVDDIASNYQQHNSMAVNNNLGPISEVEESHNLGQQQGSVGTLSTHHPIDVQQREQEVGNQNGQSPYVSIEAQHMSTCVPMDRHRQQNQHQQDSHQVSPVADPIKAPLSPNGMCAQQTTVSSDRFIQQTNKNFLLSVYSFLCILKICVVKICYCVKAQVKLMHRCFIKFDANAFFFIFAILAFFCSAGFCVGFFPQSSMHCFGKINGLLYFGEKNDLYFEKKLYCKQT